MSGWRCPECNEEYDDLQVWCRECGTRTEVVSNPENPEDTLSDKV